jgi:hypothetical protein
MYDTQTDQLTLTVYRNNQPVLTKQIIAAWFPFIHQIYLNDVSDDSYLEVINQQGETFILPSDPTTPFTDSQDNNQKSLRVYKIIQEEIEKEKENTKQLIELERMFEQQRFERELNRVRQVEEDRQHEERRIRQEEENEKKSQAELELLFHQMVSKRQREKAEAERLKVEQELRIKTLTETLLPNLKNDPTIVLSVLESEIIQYTPAQTAVAEAITVSDEACSLVINSPTHLWNSNFIIMEAIIIKVTYNNNLAQMIRTVFPPDHLLITMLDRVGRR